MKRITHALPFGKVQAVGLAILLGSLATGCTEVNVAIDELLGKQPPSLYAAASDQSRLPTILAKKRPAGERPPSREPQIQPPSEERTPSATPSSTTPTPPEKPKEVQARPQPAVPPAETPPTPPEKPQETKAQEQPPSPAAPDQAITELSLHQVKGKKAPPGAMPPAKNEEMQGAPTEPTTTEPATFTGIKRDPFKAPTEILPSECPPSMPLCKFDRSQLKLVGVIQVSDGQFKGMVEDPDGRGYFVTPGMQIGGATVTQVTQRGITLHLRKTGQDVVLPLFLESRESREL